MKKPVYTIWALWVALAVAVPGLFADAKEGNKGAQAGPRAHAPAAPPPPQAGHFPGAGQRADRPVYPLDRWAAMSPAQRDEMMSRMKPERRQNLQERLAHWQSLPEPQKERVRAFFALPPDQKRIVREHAEWMKTLPQPRRQAIRHQLQVFEQMSPEARQAELDSPSFTRRFDPVEREQLRKMVSTMPRE